MNMMQAFGGPTTYYLQSKERKHLDASERNYQTIRELYGQVPGGLFGGDENCRPGHTDPRQAVETFRTGVTDRWPAWEVRPSTPWNYGLVLDPDGPSSSFQVAERARPKTDMPFTSDGVPIALKAKARRIPEWQLDRFGLVATLQDNPVKSDQPTETVTLIPMGAAADLRLPRDRQRRRCAHLGGHRGAQAAFPSQCLALQSSTVA